MKKTPIVLLCLFVSAPLTHASFFSMGPRVGGSTSQVSVNSASDNTALTGLKQTNHWNYHAGVFTRFNLLLCYVQPEILFASFDAKSRKDNKVLKLSCTKLDIPAMVGFSFLGVLRVQLGPVFSWLLSAKEGTKNVRGRYSSTTTGWQAGLGVDIWKIVVDFKYESSASKFEDKNASISTEYGSAPWILSIGFNIL